MKRHHTIYFAFGLSAIACYQAALAADPPRSTETPIEHLIVVVGENISFDNLFATYEPPPGQTVGNLLSRGIVNKDGSPGPRFADAAQHQASVGDRYAVVPATAAVFTHLPQLVTTYALALPRDALV